MVTSTQVKNALGITTTKYDTQITELIPLVTEMVKVRCNLTEIPTAHDDTLIQIIGYRLFKQAGVVSESLSRHSQAFDPDFEEKQLKKIGRRLRW